jgi:hypothetical protein
VREKGIPGMATRRHPIRGTDPRREKGKGIMETVGQQMLDALSDHRRWVKGYFSTGGRRCLIGTRAKIAGITDEHTIAARRA